MIKLQFEISADTDESYRDRVMQILLWTLVGLNREYLRAHPDTPPLYSSGVRYGREEETFEQWCDIGMALRQGAVDCEDLVCWRVAELRECGIDARPAWYHRPVKSSDTGRIARLYHIQVWTPNGIEDPSARLGMNDPLAPVIRRTA
jgi:hypothetical protein